jgi:methylglutamate dehydrogenase subunit D
VSEQSAASHVSGAKAGLALELAPHYFRAGLRGARLPQPGVTLELIAEEDRFNIEARRGRAADLMAAIAESFGAAPADGPRTVEAGGFSFVGVGPSRWHAISRGPERTARRDALAQAVRERATIVDVSHGFVAFRLSGPKVVDALAKLVRLDLDPASFPPGAVAGTELHGMSVQLRRTRDGEAYECAVARSFASSLFHALTSAADPYGVWVDMAV